eukprot:366377-Chlamydomonas_euryale.AAC.9
MTHAQHACGRPDVQQQRFAPGLLTDVMAALQRMGPLGCKALRLFCPESPDQPPARPRSYRRATAGVRPPGSSGSSSSSSPPSPPPRAACSFLSCASWTSSAPCGV